jgi:5-methylcytosine-specific restriction endonuclease McrA
MKNLNLTGEDLMLLFDEVVSGKTDATLKATLNASKPTINFMSSIYYQKFQTNTLEGLIANATCAAQKKTLDELYRYGSVAIQSFKQRIELAQHRAVRYVCQYCTLTPHDSFDHYVPNSEFPEFCVQSLNLVPACTTCNRKKTSIWRNAGRRTALNLYIDILPNIQYVFVDIFWDSQREVDFEYRLANPHGVNAQLFELISEHYVRLNLLNRFRKAAISEFTTLLSRAQKDLAFRPYDEILDDVLQDGNDMRPKFGFNHWRAVLEIALGTSTVFRDALLGIHP